LILEILFRKRKKYSNLKINQILYMIKLLICMIDVCLNMMN